MSKAQHPGGKQGPLKATIPISGVVKQNNIHISPTVTGAPASPLLRWNRSRASPEHATSGQRSPGASCYKGKQDGVALETMRRTASLDTVYLSGHWPKDHFHWGHMGTLQVDKATQTENNYWTEARHLHYIADSEDGFMTKIRGKQTSTGGDSTLNNSSQTSASCLTRSHPVHLSPVKSLPKSSMRSSVEGLNQEIERIVLRTGADPYQNVRSDSRQATPEGHRAPLAEMLQSSRSRSVNTQTPQDFSNSSGDSHGSSPDTEAKLGTSPHINRFLAREPPDGCEKVRLKSSDERTDVLLDRAPQPSSFKLRPSLGSAFKMLQPARSPSADSAPQ